MITVTVDPFRFAAAVTDVVESGSYTGNGATDRTIPLAFTPALVIVICETALSPMYVSNISPGTFGWYLDEGLVASIGSSSNAQRPAVTTNGFIVSGNTTDNNNQNSRTFNYFAFG